jgi:hypothetical protein
MPINKKPIVVKPKKSEEELSFVKFDNPLIIKEIEKNFPEMTDEYKRIMWTQYEIFCKKQHNYGPDNISVGTDLKTVEDIKLSMSGLWFRLNDKIQRLKQLTINNKVDIVAESVQDTLSDLSNYGIIGQIVKNKKWGK